LLGLIGYSLYKNLIVNIKYITVDSLMDLYSRDFQSYNLYKESSILCLDDFGWLNFGYADNRLMKFTDFIKFRYGKELPTFIASNISIKDIMCQDNENYKQIANILNDQTWIKQFNYGFNPKDSKRGKL
jgi:DNA replication protein DnaC